MTLAEKAQVFEALKNGDLDLNDARIDFEQIMIDIVINEATDTAIGISGELYKQGMQGMDILSR